MLSIFTKLPLSPNKSGFVRTDFKCVSWNTLFLVVNGGGGRACQKRAYGVGLLGQSMMSGARGGNID